MRRTKIIATIGPSSINKIKEIIKYADIIRINFAHGDGNSRKEYIEKIRNFSTDIPILVDLPGPKLRIGKLNKLLYLNRGDKIIFSNDLDNSIPINDDSFFKYVKVGDIILISDGKIKLRVINKDNNKVEGIVLEGGIISSGKGINIPNLDIKSGVTDNDIKLLKEALKYDIDFIGISFVMTKDDILKVKRIVNDKIWVISKIENKKALKNLKEIIKESDGIMVARGDLGIEVGLENLPFVQNKIIKMSRYYGKPVILATQVLESMVDNEIPTRAEVIDVANSIYQSVDAIMLSDETAIGKYPIESIKELNNLIINIENKIKRKKIKLKTSYDAVALAAVDLSEISKSKLIIAFSRTGKTIMRISRLRPKIPIIGFTNNKNIYKKLKIFWGVDIEYTDKQLNNIFEIIKYSEYIAKKYIKEGDIVIIGGDPLLEKGRTDFIKLHHIR